MRNKINKYGTLIDQFFVKNIILYVFYILLMIGNYQKLLFYFIYFDC